MQASNVTNNKNRDKAIKTAFKISLIPLRILYLQKRKVNFMEIKTKTAEVLNKQPTATGNTLEMY